MKYNKSKNEYTNKTHGSGWTFEKTVGGIAINNCSIEKYTRKDGTILLQLEHSFKKDDDSESKLFSSEDDYQYYIEKMYEASNYQRSGTQTAYMFIKILRKNDRLEYPLDSTSYDREKKED